MEVVIHRPAENLSAFPQPDPCNPHDYHTKHSCCLSPQSDPPMSRKGNGAYKDHPCSASSGQTKNYFFPDRKHVPASFSKFFQKIFIDADTITAQCSHPDSSSDQWDQYSMPPEKKQPARYQSCHCQHLFFPVFYSQPQPPQIPQKQNRQFYKHPSCFFFL